MIPTLVKVEMPARSKCTSFHPPLLLLFCLRKWWLKNKANYTTEKKNYLMIICNSILLHHFKKSTKMFSIIINFYIDIRTILKNCIVFLRYCLVYKMTLLLCDLSGIEGAFDSNEPVTKKDLRIFVLCSAAMLSLISNHLKHMHKFATTK